MANPLVNARLENILKERKVKVELKNELFEVCIDDGNNDDEVSVLFYGNSC